MPDKRMVEIATGHVSNRNQIAELSNISSYIFEANMKTETYHSWYCFDEQLKQHIDSVGTIQGFNGAYYINSIILDFDKKDLEDKVLYDAVHWLVNTEMVEDLGIKEEHILVWYSGTGFHIEIPNLFGFNPSTTLPGVVKETLQTIFPECDNIYDGARLIRAPFSYNSKKGNYKIPFTVKGFNSYDIDTIKKASNEGFKEKHLSSIDSIRQLWEHLEPYLQSYIKYPETRVIAKDTVRSQFRIDPNSVVTCMQNVIGKAPVVGERNDTMMRVGSWMRRTGMPLDVVKHTLRTWSGLGEEADDCASKVFETGYEYGCNDYLMAKHCKPECIYFKHKDYSMNLKNADDMADEYAEFLQKDFTNSSFNFADIYKMNQDFWVLPGELVIVSGNTGMGKSTWVMNLVSKIPHLPVMFLSLENQQHLTFRRFIQMCHGLTKEEAMAVYRDPEKKREYQKAFSHVQVTCEPPELSRLIEGIARSKPKVVVVDTSDMIWVKGIHDEIGKMNEIINGLKGVAQNQDCIVIVVHHVNKEAQNTGVVRMSSLKGTSNVSQKADKVLVINGEMHELRRSVTSEKARDEGYMQLMFEFSRKDFLFNQVSGEGGFNVQS